MCYESISFWYVQQVFFSLAILEDKQVLGKENDDADGTKNEPRLRCA